MLLKLYVGSAITAAAAVEVVVDVADVVAVAAVAAEAVAVAFDLLRWLLLLVLSLS